MEPRYLMIKVHTNPSAMRGSLFFLLCHRLSFTCIANRTRFLSLIHCNRKEKNNQDMRTKRKKKKQIFEENSQGLTVGE